jgi:putative ATPase
MLEGGEDPRFIARRMVIYASEDVGNADPQALLVANAAAHAADREGPPQRDLHPPQAAAHQALAPTSNAATTAITPPSSLVR